MLKIKSLRHCHACLEPFFFPEELLLLKLFLFQNGLWLLLDNVVQQLERIA